MRLPVILIILTVFGLQSSPVQAQTTTALPDPTEAYLRILPTVEFDDLPLAEVTEILRSEFPEVNFIIQPEVDDVIVRLQLRNVSLDDILVAIQIATERDMVFCEQTQKGRLITLRTDPVEPSSDNTPRLRAFSLTEFLGRFPQDEREREIALAEMSKVLSTGIEMLNKSSAGRRGPLAMPEMQVHKGSQMLIVVGTPAQLEVVTEIVNNLPGMRGAHRQDARTTPADPANDGFKYDEKFLRRYGLEGQLGSGTSK